MQDYRWSIKELTETINKTKQVDKDYPIIIDGETGSGKSSLGLLICIKGDPKFNIETDIIYSRDELVDKIMNSEPGRYYLLDEAINLLFKRDFAAKKQKFIIRLLDMCRDRNLCLIMCAPNFWSMDKHILEGRVKLRIHVARTGLAFLWKPTGNPFTPDKWCRKYNEKVCSNWDSYPNAKRTKGFIGYVKFGDLAGGYKDRYLKIKETKKAMVAKQEEEEEKKKEKDKEKGMQLGQLKTLVFLQSQGLLKRGALIHYASMNNVKPNTLHKQLKRYREGFEELDGNDSDGTKKLYNNSINQIMLDETSKEGLHSAI